MNGVVACINGMIGLIPNGNILVEDDRLVKTEVVLMLALKSTGAKGLFRAAVAREVVIAVVAS